MEIQSSKTRVLTRKEVQQIIQHHGLNQVMDMLILLKRSFVCPDFIDQAQAEGECQQLKTSDILCDLATVLKNKSSYAAVKSKQNSNS